jgi:MFS-type transporter involved in bile tolerance (Atg22 family)
LDGTCRKSSRNNFRYGLLSLFNLFTQTRLTYFVATVVFAMGAGFAQAMRSFVTSLVSRENIGVLYMLIAIVDAIGSLIAPPFFGWSLAAGLKPDAKVKGLPFVLAALMYGISAISVWSIRKHDEEEQTQLSEVEPLLIEEE